MKTVVDFLKDLEEVQTLISNFNREADGFFELLQEGTAPDPVRLETIDHCLSDLGIPADSESRLALITRLVSLRDDSLVQVMKKIGRSSDQELDSMRDHTYAWVSSYYLRKHEELIQQISERQLLTPFYRAALAGWHRVGVAMTEWQPLWTQTILREVNRSLIQQFEGDEDKTNAWLHESGLIDKGHDGEPGDRCYSVLQKQGESSWKSVAYVNAFPEEVQKVCKAIHAMELTLSGMEDRTFHEKEAWVGYLQALQKAFSGEEPNSLIELWSDVDRKWMNITGPIQPGHPLEYYEDHFRKAVALEWDVRIANPEHASKGRRRDKVRSMCERFYADCSSRSSEQKRIVRFCSQKLDSVQLHIGRFGMFYGSGFIGLSSAQVVPNDEVVSKEAGKKVFAFPDNILQTMQARPFVRLSKEVFGQDFLTRERKVLFQDRELWFRIYDISTIGHEYGHILWVDDDTEARMNHRGNYKNVEEWKATTGGLMAYFMDTEDGAGSWELCYHVVSDLVKRSIGLIGWRETSEVLPYYIEGLIHLQGLFDSKVLSFDSKSASPLGICITAGTVSALKDWYTKVYRDLVDNYYLMKQDPTDFLRRYSKKRGQIYVPASGTIDQMAEWYWDLYQKYGREIDHSDSRSNYQTISSVENQ
jgi:hypothetical protein